LLGFVSYRYFVREGHMTNNIALLLLLLLRFSVGLIMIHHG